MNVLKRRSRKSVSRFQSSTANHLRLELALSRISLKLFFVATTANLGHAWSRTLRGNMVSTSLCWKDSSPCRFTRKKYLGGLRLLFTWSETTGAIRAF